MSAAAASEVGVPEPTAAHDRYVERADDRDEPSRTKGIRQRYAQQLRGRWKAIRAAIRTGIVENDALGLRTEALVDAPTDFDFGTDASKEQAFNEWLQAAVDDEILQQFGGENQHIAAAYERGLSDAQTELRALGFAEDTEVGGMLQLPVHRDQLEHLYTRNLNELEGMTESVATDLRRELSEGLASGEGSRTIASDLTDVIGEVEDGTPHGAMNRATRIARTEVMNSHNWGRLQEWERAGVEKVDVIVAGDACDLCLAYAAGAPYLAKKAYSNLPRHPNCRCSHTIYTKSS